jgi:hypothetical protein
MRLAFSLWLKRQRKLFSADQLAVTGLLRGIGLDTDHAIFRDELVHRDSQTLRSSAQERFAGGGDE